MNFYQRIVYFIKKRIALKRDIIYHGRANLKMHASTHLMIKNSKIIIENGTFEVGMAYGKYGGYGIDPRRDNCRIHLQNSTLTIKGNVKLYPGVKIIANNAEITIHDGTKINAPSLLLAEKNIEIGKNCLISYNVTIRDNDGHPYGIKGESPDFVVKDIKISDNVWIGQNVIILKGVEIGTGSMIAAGSVINKNVPGDVLAGNNSKVLKENIYWIN